MKHHKLETMTSFCLCIMVQKQIRRKKEGGEERKREEGWSKER
jgi:hypothetical protein